MKLLLTTLLSILMSTTAFSAISMNNSSSYVDIIIKSVANNQNFVKFNYCQADTPCEFLGPQEYYSLNDLKRQRVYEYTQIFYAVLTNVLVVSGAMVAYMSLPWHLFPAFMTALDTTPGAAVGLILALGSVTGVTVGLNSIVDSINPIEQYKQVKAFSDAIGNEDYILEKDDFKDFVFRLKLVLNKINEDIESFEDDDIESFQDDYLMP